MAENGLMESELKVEELKADFAKLHPPPKMNEALEQVIEICRKHPEGLPNLKTFLNELIPWIQVKDSQAESKRMRNYDGHRGIGFKKPSVNVHRIVTSKTHGADDQIIEKLGKKLQLIDSGLADCAGVLLFCVANTRAGSDVDEAMGKIPVAAREKPVILVLMHHDYNKDCAIDTTDLSTEYDKVELHVNVIFHQSKKGLLNCKRNDDAIKEIVKQCKQWNPET